MWRRLPITPSIGRYEIFEDFSYDDALGAGQILWSATEDREKLSESEQAFRSALGQRFQRGKDVFKDILADLVQANFDSHRSFDRNASSEEIYNLARQDVQKIINKMPEKIRNSRAFREASRELYFEYLVEEIPASTSTEIQPQETTKPAPPKPQKTVGDCDREYDTCWEGYSRVQKEIDANSKAAVKAGHSIEDEPWVTNWEILMQKLESIGRACTVQFDACCVEIGLYPSNNTGVCRYKP